MVSASPFTARYYHHAPPFVWITEICVCAGQHVSSRLQYSTGGGLVRWLMIILKFSVLNLGIQSRALHPHCHLVT